MIADLARWQFGITTTTHWMFVMVTLGMVIAVVYLQTRANLTRDPRKRAQLYKMTRYWGLMYVINYAMGIASGIILEFQFGTNWSGLTHFVGNVFGAPLAVETLVAFVAESTFLALWIFGWGKLPRWAHTTLIWLVAASAYASAFWVLLANGFMHAPDGYDIGSDGAAHLDSVAALLLNGNAWWAFLHVIGAGLAGGGVIIVIVSAVHLYRRSRQRDFFVRSFRLGYVMGFAGMMWTFLTGWAQYGHVVQNQPGKSLEVMAGGERAVAINATLTQQFGQGDWLPSGGVFTAFIVMMTIGESAGPCMLFGLPLLIREWSAKARWLLPVFWLALPLPFVAAAAGWMFREMGRQPWIVYGLQSTQDAVSDISVTSMWTSLIVFSAIGLSLLFTNWWLIGRAAARGPEREIFGVLPDGTIPAPEDSEFDEELLPEGKRHAGTVLSAAGGRVLRLLRFGRLRLRGRRASDGRSPHRPRAPHDAIRIGPVLSRQRGVARRRIGPTDRGVSDARRCAAVRAVPGSHSAHSHDCHFHRCRAAAQPIRRRPRGMRLDHRR
ncbi:MAG TPA: cytochrome ubiquinol oxidase subunit I [Candidatus Stackebrandtia faecavium]|nr:cytochrome ubiquinol oxidase subunit I [Candidatus Stackebrandtia faecavium]